MVSKITGKFSASPIWHLKVNNVEVTDFSDIANTTAQTFSNNSSSENYSSTLFSVATRQAENQQLKFKSNNYENYNNPFSLDELTDAVSKSHDTAVGPDDIHCQMLEHLSDDALLTLLNILNNIWASGKFPTSWCTYTVIPVPKPSKDTSDPSNYRPTAPTSCICKVVERMINSRLVLYLERNKLSYAMRLPQTTHHYRSSGTIRILCQRSFRSATTCCRSLF